MWERTLQDLIRGLRANKQDESKFIAKAIDEIRAEIRTDDMDLKAGAVLKLAYVCLCAKYCDFFLLKRCSARNAGLRYVLGFIPCR